MHTKDRLRAHLLSIFVDLTEQQQKLGHSLAVENA